MQSLRRANRDSNNHGVAVAEVRDLHGRSYRVGERAQDITGHSRRWMLWLCWAAMAGIGVFQYGYGVAVTPPHTNHPSRAAGAPWGLAPLVVVPARPAAPPGPSLPPLF